MAYYLAAAEKMLPHLIGRPLTLQRFPAGIDKPGFMQKNAGKGFPAFIERVDLPKQGGMVAYPAISDLEGLLYLANQNTITFHIPCFRTHDLEHPDRLVFDLDPTDGDLDGARFGATEVHGLLSDLKVPSWVMTTGSKGFHVVVPLAPTISFESLGSIRTGVSALTVIAIPRSIDHRVSQEGTQGSGLRRLDAQRFRGDRGMSLLPAAARRSPYRDAHSLGRARDDRTIAIPSARSLGSTAGRSLAEGISV